MDEKAHCAIGGTSVAPFSALLSVNAQRLPKSVVGPWRSRTFLKSIISNIVADLIQQFVQSSGFCVCCHLSIPIIILPAVDPLGDLSAFLKRQLLNCRLDFFNSAHGGIIPHHHFLSHSSVTHPSEADFTSRMYFANVPRVTLYFGCFHCFRRRFRSAVLILTGMP